MKFGNEPGVHRDFGRLGEPKVREVWKQGVTRFEVAFKNWQRVKWTWVLFEDDGGTIPKSISFMHWQQETGMWAGQTGQFYRTALNGFPIVPGAMVIRVDKFT